jgi:hypothetical protein
MHTRRSFLKTGLLFGAGLLAACTPAQIETAAPVRTTPPDTATPIPADTATVVPSATPAATIPAATATAVPTNTPVPTQTEKPAYPIRAEKGKRYVVDAQGQPFLIQGDTPWSLITGLTKNEAQDYLRNRAEKGFNSLIVNLIEHKFNGPQTRDGLLPFTSPSNLSGPVEAYFQHADWVIQTAAQHKIQIFLAPIYLGYDNGVNDEGWYEEVLNAGVEGCRAWGRYVGKRYGQFDNLVWLIGGDRNPGDASDPVEAFVAGLKEFDNRHVFTAHAAPNNVTTEQFGKGGWLTLNSTYAYDWLLPALRDDYARVHDLGLPYFLIETTYENEHDASDITIRRQAYWALLTGATGQFFGNNPIWLFDPGWREAMDGQGSRSMAVLKRLFDARPWYSLVPDLDHSMVNDGQEDTGGDESLAAALAEDGSTLLAYIPSARPLHVDLSRMSGKTAAATWFSPQNGKAQKAGEYPTQGTQEFSPPGEGDWVLVIDDPAQKYPALG